MNCGTRLAPETDAASGAGTGRSARPADPPTDILFKPPALPSGRDADASTGGAAARETPGHQVPVPEIQMGSDPWQLAEAGFTPAHGNPSGADPIGTGFGDFGADGGPGAVDPNATNVLPAAAGWAPGENDPTGIQPAYDPTGAPPYQGYAEQGYGTGTSSARAGYGGYGAGYDTPDATSVMSAGSVPAYADDGWGDQYDDGYYGYDEDRPTGKLSVLLFLAVVVAGLAVGSAFLDLFDVSGTGTNFDGPWKVNDLATNLAVAVIIPAVAALIGAGVAFTGARWGAGLAGGAGLAITGWAALSLGLVELQQKTFLTGAAFERQPGYWILLAAGGGGVVVFLWSLTRAASGHRGGLDPWVAALGAVAVLVAVAGPLIPQGSADFSSNFQQTGVPDLFFVGRMVQLALFAVTGVVGFLLVRRYGLGLAIGGALTVAWLTITAALELTDAPVGPGVTNPGGSATEPHAMTVVGLVLVGFFLLVAAVMALLDSD